MENENLKFEEDEAKPWYKYFTALELTLAFFGSALVYIILNIIYFEVMKKILL